MFQALLKHHGKLPVLIFKWDTCVINIMLDHCFERQLGVFWMIAVEIPERLCKGEDIMYLWLYFLPVSFCH